MKLATFRTTAGAEHIGIVHENDSCVFDLTAAAASETGGCAPTFASMLALIDGGDAALEEAGLLFAAHGTNSKFLTAVDSVELLSPLPQPRQIRDCMSYETHIRQSGRGLRRLMASMAGKTDEVAEIDAEPLTPLADIYRQQPIYYITNRMIMGAPGATVNWPRYSQVMDYELEYGIVVGKTAANISTDNARYHIFGYTIFNDFSARDQQSKDMPGWLGPGKGKSFDGGNVLGPWIVTKDEIHDPYSMKARVLVNGNIRCESTTAGMLFDFEQMLAYMSKDETIHAGEVICSGTIGNGCGLETGIFLNDGDVVELEFDMIGILKNKVVRQTA